MAGSVRRSTRVIWMAAVLGLASAALFAWIRTFDFTPAEGLTREDVLATVDRIAGGIGGAGLGLLAVAVVLRLRGR